MPATERVTAQVVAEALAAVEKARDAYKVADEEYQQASRNRNLASRNLDERVKTYNGLVREFGRTIPRECSYWDHPESGSSGRGGVDLRRDT